MKVAGGKWVGVGVINIFVIWLGWVEKISGETGGFVKILLT